MLFPLGLGVKIPKFPFLTLLLVALNSYLYFSQPKIDNVALEKMSKKGDQAELVSYYKEKDYLNKSNMTISSLTKAQFAHGSLLHLIGNMLALIGFGIYVEARLGVANFLLVYLLGGFLGLGGSTLLFMKPENFLLGASANVFSIMGCFFILFFKHYIRFFLFYFIVWKRIVLPVNYSFPFFFILVEVGNQLLAGSNVANDAHLIGMVAGIIFSLIFLKSNPIEWPFIYQIELDKFELVKKANDFEEQKDICNDILEFNPINYKVRLYVLSKALERFGNLGHLDGQTQQVFEDHLERYIGKFIKEKRFDLCALLLKKLPFSLALFPYFKGLSQKQIIKLADYFFDSKDYLNALRFYQVFVDYYPESKRTKNVLKTCEGILNILQKEDDLKILNSLKEGKTNNPLSLKIDEKLALKFQEGA